MRSEGRASARRPLRLLVVGLAALAVLSGARVHPQARRDASVRATPRATPPGPFQPALPGYRFEFPRDHFDHPDFQTEWWYYTGNLRGADGHAFGFELTFFRHGISRSQPAAAASPWTIRDVCLAHFAVSDIDGQAFVFEERANRSGAGIAGVEQATGRIWNGNWRVQWTGEDQRLEAVTPRATLDLRLSSTKPPVIHGIDGVSQKAAGPGRASHYISLTRLEADGSIGLDGKAYMLTGTAWMDHEFFTNQLGRDQLGWDWVGLQLDDRTEVMAGRIRRSDGSADPFSTATFVTEDGRSRHLTSAEFALTPLADTWTSPRTRATYPVAWRLRVPSLGLAIDLRTALRTQELASESSLAPSYWEGAIAARGTREGRPVAGVGYLEMTGYGPK